MPWRQMARHLGIRTTYSGQEVGADQAPGYEPPALVLGALARHPREHRPMFSTQARVLREFRVHEAVRATNW